MAAIKSNTDPKTLELLDDARNRWKIMRQLLTTEEAHAALAFVEEEWRKDTSAMEEAAQEFKEERRPL